MIGHRIMGASLLFVGDIAGGRAHFDMAIALYDPVEHRPLATRFGADTRGVVLCWRSLSLWVLGYPEAALADADYAVADAREIGQAATLMFTLANTSYVHTCCGNYDEASARVGEVVDLADEKGGSLWKAHGLILQGSLLALSGKSSDAVRLLASAMTAHRSMGATLMIPWYSSYLARAYADLDQFEDAWSHIGQAMTAIGTTKERWCEAEVNRVAGEIALMATERDAAKAEAYFNRALAVAREQQAKSWELRAATSIARLWRDQGKRQQAHDLLAPVYSWFTEGFDTLDLKQAKALLEELR